MYGMRDNNHVMLVFQEGWLCICPMHEILECLCLFMLIMIDVKLTPSGFDCLPVCMNG